MVGDVAFDSVASLDELDVGLGTVSASIRQQVLNDADGSNELAAIHLWNMNVRDGELIDPTYHFGIRLGGAEQRAIWLENQSATPTESVVKFTNR